MFDLEKIEKESKLPKKEIEKIKRSVKKEFPNDQLMYELHVLRALKYR